MAIANIAASLDAGLTVFDASVGGLGGYADLHRWSVDAPEDFWSLVRDFCEVVGDRGKRTLLAGPRMQDARWLPDARLNFAENLLRDSGNPEALVFRGENKVERRLGRSELRREVARFAAALEALGIAPGDRVAACMPNLPETLVAMLAAASLGAVFRDNASTRHVPARIVAIGDIPRTKSGKIVELAVRNVVHGQPVKNLESLADPAALQLFSGLPERAN